MSRFVLFNPTQGYFHDKFDFVTADGTRYGVDSPYVTNTIPAVEKKSFNYLEASSYDGITSLLEKLNSNDPSIANVLVSDKWIVGKSHIFYCETPILKILPVHSLIGGYNCWGAIIDTSARSA